MRTNSPILITGSNGLIGSKITATLAKDHPIIGLDLKEPQNPILNTDFIACDLTKDDSVQSAMTEVRRRYGDHLTSVVHLAAYYDFSGEPSPLYEDLTVNGTRRLLNKLQTFQVEQLIFSSSILVMKPAEDEGETITETSPVESTWDYPSSKLDAEDVLGKERGNFPVVVLRIAGVYDEMCHSIPISQQISRIYERKLESYFFPGNATHAQPFVHLEDLVACIKTTVARRKDLAPWELFLIAEPELVSYGALQDEIGELIYGHDWPTIRIPKTAAKVGAWVKDKLAGDNEEYFIKPWMIDLADAHYPVVIQRAREKLGWQPQHCLRDTLPQMVDELLKDPESWYKVNKLPLPDDFPSTSAAREGA